MIEYLEAATEKKDDIYMAPHFQSLVEHLMVGLCGRNKWIGHAFGGEADHRSRRNVDEKK